MKFIKEVDIGNNKKKNFLYEIPDDIINREFGNVYIFQNQLLQQIDETQCWLDNIMEHGGATSVALSD